jgi:cephalosporin hydroxylase
LDLYSHLVGEGMYLVVEDTNLNGHPVEPSFGSGPTEAVRDFLAKDDRFEQDDGVWSRQLFSFHAHGWLRRKA